jgi:hypothetical protein
MREVAAPVEMRMSVTNLATGESIEAQLNPTELEESLDVDYARQTVPGLSHQPLPFVQTNNTKLSLELYFDASAAGYTLDQILYARRFLQSLCYPRRGASDVVGGGPPRVLFAWPGIISLTCVITALSFKYTRFNQQGVPVQFTAKVTYEEIRDVRLTSDEVLQSGTQRSGKGPEGVS